MDEDLVYNPRLRQPPSSQEYFEKSQRSFETSFIDETLIQIKYDLVEDNNISPTDDEKGERWNELIEYLKKKNRWNGL